MRRACCLEYDGNSPYLVGTLLCEHVCVFLHLYMWLGPMVPFCMHRQALPDKKKSFRDVHIACIGVEWPFSLSTLKRIPNIPFAQRLGCATIVCDRHISTACVFPVGIEILSVPGGFWGAIKSSHLPRKPNELFNVYISFLLLFQ